MLQPGRWKTCLNTLLNSFIYRSVLYCIFYSCFVREILMCEVTPAVTSMQWIKKEQFFTLNVVKYESYTQI